MSCTVADRKSVYDPLLLCQRQRTDILTLDPGCNGDVGFISIFSPLLFLMKCCANKIRLKHRVAARGLNKLLGVNISTEEQLKGMKSISSLLQAYLVASFLSLRVEIEEIVDTNLSTEAAQLNSHKGATA